MAQAGPEQLAGPAIASSSIASTLPHSPAVVALVGQAFGYLFGEHRSLGLLTSAREVKFRWRSIRDGAAAARPSLAISRPRWRDRRREDWFQGGTRV